MRRALAITGAVIAVLVLAIAGLIGYAVSERGLSLIVGRISSSRQVGRTTP